MYSLQEAPSNCDMILVHDDDLARLGGIHGTVGQSSLSYRVLMFSYSQPIDADQPDVMLNHIRSLKPRIHSARIVLGELFPYCNSHTSHS